MSTAAAEGRISAYISIGSNLGDAVGNLAKGRSTLDSLPGARLGAMSAVYRTEPLNMPGQAFFANQVVELVCEAGMRPDDLLDKMLAAETLHGRVREQGLRYGARTLDLDLLLFGAARVEAPRLILPHPRMLERAFVLVPLAELAPDLLLPQGMTVREALARIAYTRDEGGTIFQGKR